ncbi:MAG TPA: helix-turn-helix transcriptional regulator [Gaiellales bacterium]|nr:helix-turn-helix transcriptional regulator [Gaiellales bacterium]
MFALSPDVRVDAGRQALDLPDLPRGLHARHVARLVHNLLAAGLLEEARAEFGEARAAVRSSGETAAAYSLQLTEAALDYTDGRFERSLDLTDAALRAGPGGGEDTVQRFAQQWRCGALTVLDRLDESLRAAADGVAAAQRDRQAWALHAFEAGRGRLLLQMGRLQDAAATLEGQFGPADADAMPAISDAAGVVALGRVALHTGDRSQTRRTAETARAMLEQGAPGVRRHAAWLLALQAMAEGDAFGARAWLCALGVEQRTSLLPLFPADITDEAHLVRIAVAADDLELAESATAAAERRAAINPGVRSILATAAHARGLQHGDRRALEQAVQLFESGPRPLALASALEDLGVASVDRGSEEERIEAFSRALVLYSHAGAVWDAGRVRGRLRALGVRRRLVTPARPARGWAGLTDAELAVVRIVAEGLSNREASQRLFLSPHTVSSHLRHAFNKLGINSRVELTRMVLTHDRAD